MREVEVHAATASAGGGVGIGMYLYLVYFQYHGRLLLVLKFILSWYQHHHDFLYQLRWIPAAVVTVMTKK